MKRKHAIDLIEQNPKKQKVLPAHSLFTLPSELLVHITQCGEFSLQDIQSLKSSCSTLNQSRVMQSIENKKKQFINDLRMNPSTAYSHGRFFFNQENHNQLLFNTYYSEPCMPCNEYELSETLKNPIGSIKEIFPSNDFVLLHCEKGIFGIAHGTLFHIDTTVLEQKYGKILQLSLDSNTGFFLCEKGLLGFGYNEYGQLGLGDKHILPSTATECNLLEYIFNNLRPIAEETFDLINKAGKVLKIVNEWDNSLIICEQAIFGCGRNNYEQLGLGFYDEITEFKLIEFNLEEAGQFIQASIGEQHTLLLYENKLGEYNLYGCGSNELGQLAMLDKNIITRKFIKLDIPQNKGKPLMISTDDLASYLLCENGLFGVGDIGIEWKVDLDSVDESDNFWKNEPWLSPADQYNWISLDDKYKMFKKKGEILKIIPGGGVLCEKGMFLVKEKFNGKSNYYYELSLKAENSIEVVENVESITLKINS